MSLSLYVLSCSFAVQFQYEVTQNIAINYVIKEKKKQCKESESWSEQVDKVDRYTVNIKKPDKSGYFCHTMIKFSAYFMMMI